MNIVLSPKYGINPVITLCPLCGGDSSIAMPGKMSVAKLEKMGFDKSDISGDVNDATVHRMVDQGPCSMCEGMMKTHILFMEAVEDGKGVRRTGRMAWVREGAALDIVVDNDPLREQIKKTRVTYIESDAWEKAGFNRIQENGK